MKRLLLILFFITTTLCFSMGASATSTDANQLEFSNVQSIETSTVSVDIEIHPSYTDQVYVEITLDENSNYEFKYSITGSNLRFWLENQSILNLFSSDKNSLIKLYIPHNLDLDIHTSSGDIRINKIVANNLECSSTSGDTDIADSKAVITSNSTSGYIMINRHEGASKAYTTSGNIQINTLEGSIDTNSTSGEIRIINVEDSIRAASNSGSIYLANCNNVQKATTISGDIQGVGIHTGSSSYMSTISGEIFISLNKNIEDYSFDAYSLSGDIRVPNTRDNQRYRVELKSTSGDINVQ